MVVERYITVARAAGYAQYSVTGFHRVVKRDGGLHVAKVGPKKHLIRRDEFNKWLVARGMPTLEEQAA